MASAQTAVDGLDVEIAGDLVPGSRSALTVTIRRDNAPVTTLQPYLGAFGHLVALREGDLAYLHVHPESTAPLRQAQGPEATSGPEVHFGAHVSDPCTRRPSFWTRRHRTTTDDAAHRKETHP